MVVRRRRKVRKLRGSRTYGWGIQGQHRGSGLRGGVGKAGRKSGKHLWSWVLRYDPDYFGKHGFKRPREAATPVVPINVGELDEIIEELANKGLALFDGDRYKVNLRELGYTKLLGRGKVKHKIVVEGKISYSKIAFEKLKSAGGEIIVG